MELEGLEIALVGQCVSGKCMWKPRTLLYTSVDIDMVHLGYTKNNTRLKRAQEKRDAIKR